jgi:chromosome segregation ATPase
MDSDDRIGRLEQQLEDLTRRQDALRRELARAQRDQWQGRIEDLEVQFHLGAMEANDRARALLEELRSRWADVRTQLDDVSSTAGGVRESMWTGVENAVRDLRAALLESKARISG